MKVKGINSAYAGAAASRKWLHSEISRTKPIEHISIGDTVLAWDEKKCRVVRRKVVRLFRSRNHTIEIYYNDATGRMGQIECTSKHPFWTLGGAWVAAADLNQSMELLTIGTGSVEAARVSCLRASSKIREVFNFEVEDAHNYFVTKSGILVHNSSDPGHKLRPDQWLAIRAAKGPLTDIDGIRAVDDMVEARLQYTDSILQPVDRDRIPEIETSPYDRTTPQSMRPEALSRLGIGVDGGAIEAQRALFSGVDRSNTSDTVRVSRAIPHGILSDVSSSPFILNVDPRLIIPTALPRGSSRDYRNLHKDWLSLPSLDRASLGNPIGQGTYNVVFRSSQFPTIAVKLPLSGINSSLEDVATHDKSYFQKFTSEVQTLTKLRMAGMNAVVPHGLIKVSTRDAKGVARYQVGMAMEYVDSSINFRDKIYAPYMLSRLMASRDRDHWKGVDKNALSFVTPSTVFDLQNNLDIRLRYGFDIDDGQELFHIGDDTEKGTGHLRPFDSSSISPWGLKAPLRAGISSIKFLQMEYEFANGLAEILGLGKIEVPHESTLGRVKFTPWW